MNLVLTGNALCNGSGSSDVLTFNETPPPTGSAPWAYGIIDYQHLGLLVGTSSLTPSVTIRSANIWQATSANNITN